MCAFGRHIWTIANMKGILLFLMGTKPPVHLSGKGGRCFCLRSRWLLPQKEAGNGNVIVVRVDNPEDQNEKHWTQWCKLRETWDSQDPTVGTEGKRESRRQWEPVESSSTWWEACILMMSRDSEPYNSVFSPQNEYRVHMCLTWPPDTKSG